MKSICDLFRKNTIVENTGDNYGIEVANNSGNIIFKKGLGYTDTKALCLDVVHDELCKYKAEAQVEAEKRNEELFNCVISKLSELSMTDEQALTEFKNPAMQFDYIEAQKAYIKAGTPELASVLSDILVKRVNESSRTLLQIALGEAITVAPKLIPTQMATLALAFNLTHTMRPSVNNHNLLVEHLRETIIPIFQSGLSNKQSEFQHLNFTGCSQYIAGSRKLSQCLRTAYMGLFMKGFGKEKLLIDETGSNLIDLYPQLFIRCLNNPKLWQINAMTEDILTSSMSNANVISNHQEFLRKVFKENVMNDDETQCKVIDILPEMKDIFDYWANSDVARISLTSVGIVIGAQYSKLINGIDYDLSIWI